MFKNILIILSACLCSSTIYGIDISLEHQINLEGVSEPSGITHNPKTDLLYIVGDEGDIYECDKDGNVLRSEILGALDLEGITYNIDNNRLYCLEEKSPSLLEVDIEKLQIVNTYKLKGLVNKDLKQFESLTYSPVNQIGSGQFFMGSSVKSTKSGLITSFIINNSNIIKVDTYAIPLWDVAGLSYVDNRLFMVSDNKDKLATIDLSNSSFTAISIAGENQEGVTTFNHDKILVLDETNRILIHSLK